MEDFTVVIVGHFAGLLEDSIQRLCCGALHTRLLNIM
jgi:hypothetical protein